MQKSWRLGAGQAWGRGTAAGGPLSHPRHHPAPTAGWPPSWTLVGVGAGPNWGEIVENQQKANAGVWWPAQS